MAVDLNSDFFSLLDSFVMDTLSACMRWTGDCPRISRWKRQRLFRDVVNAPWFNDGLDDKDVD